MIQADAGHSVTGVSAVLAVLLVVALIVLKFFVPRRRR